jgi:hypothetical protein
MPSRLPIIETDERLATAATHGIVSATMGTLASYADRLVWDNAPESIRSF